MCNEFNVSSSLQRRGKKQRGGGNEQDQDEDTNRDEYNVGDEHTATMEAELAAIREEVAALKKVFEERYQPQ